MDQNASRPPTGGSHIPRPVGQTEVVMIGCGSQPEKVVPLDGKSFLETFKTEVRITQMEDMFDKLIDIVLFAHDHADDTTKRGILSRIQEIELE